MKEKRGKLFVISGPSGSGKDTLLKEILRKDDNIRLSISATTRNKRSGEVDGVDYYFKTPAEFSELIEWGGLLEWAEYCGHFYGTPREPIEKWLEKGYNVILEIDIDGAMQIMRKSKEAEFVFIMPPSIEELEDRLIKRGSESAEEIKMRVLKAKEEITFADKYDHIIVNRNITEAKREILDIILQK